MMPRRVYNPPIRPSSIENHLKGPLPDWDSPNSHTSTVKRRPPSLEETNAIVIVSAIDIETLAINKKCTEEIGTTATLAATTASVVTASTEGFEINEEVERQRTKILLQEIVPGNCIPNEKEKGNKSLEQNRNYTTNENLNKGGGDGEAGDASGVTSTVAITGIQYRKSRLKLPNQLSVNSKSGIVAAIVKETVVATAECDESKQFAVKQTKTTTAHGISAACNRARQSAVGPRHPQVQRLKEGSQQQQQQPSAQSSMPVRNAVASATADPKSLSANNNKSNELHKNKSKHAIPPDETAATSKKILFKKLPEANKLKFEDPTSPSTTVFTELYRDFPVNYASAAAVESIPLKPPPYCNPPPAPSPSTIPAHNRQLANCLPIEQTPLLHPSPHQIRLEKENESALTGISNQQTEKQQQASTTTSRSAAGRKSEADTPSMPATKSDCTTAHRIANELRLKGNFALQKLTNISKLNNKNNRFFSSSSSSSASSSKASSTNNTVAKKTGDESLYEKATIATAGNATVTAAVASTANLVSNIKDDDDKDATRENLNDSILFSSKNGGGNAGALVKTDAKKSPPCDILTKPEFSSSLFKNIPVRPRKGVPHLENYCLFDPSKDFVNEKEVKRLEALAAARAAITHNDFVITHQEYTYDEQLVYDTLEDESPSANYFTIDPDFIEREPVHSSPNTTMERHSQQIENIEKIIDDFLSNSKNGSDKVDLIDRFDRIVMLRTSSPRMALKNSPQIDKLFRQTTLPSAARRAASLPAPSKCDDSSPISTVAKMHAVNKHHQRSLNVNQTRDSREIRQSRLSKRTTLKHSISLPQLQNLMGDVDAGDAVPSSTHHAITVANEPNYALFNPLANTSCVRSIQYKKRHGRPLSTHSDADSGFLSPVTPPEAPTLSANATAEPPPTVVVLLQCDSIQGYIEVCSIPLHFIHKHFPV